MKLSVVPKRGNIKGDESNMFSTNVLLVTFAEGNGASMDLLGML